MEKYKNEYLLYISSELALSKNTQYNYKNDIEKYCDFIVNVRKKTDPMDIEIEDVRAFIGSLRRKHIAPSTQSRNLSALKSFHKFLLLEKYVKVNVAKMITNPKQEKKLPITLSIDEIDQLLKSLKTDSPIAMRDKAMIELAYSSGLRVSELVNLKISDYHPTMGFVDIMGKGNKERIVPIGLQAVKMIKLYVKKSRGEILGKRESEFLFISKKGSKLNRKSVWRLLKGYVDRTNIKKNITPHTLRHSFATHLIENGADLRSVQELLGHMDISTTQVYTHLAKKKLQEFHSQFHPKG